MSLLKLSPETRRNLNWFLILILGYSYALVVNWKILETLNYLDKAVLVIMTMASYLVIPLLVGLLISIKKDWVKKSQWMLISVIGFIPITNTNGGYINFLQKQNYQAELIANRFVINYRKTLPRKANDYTRIDDVDFKDDTIILKFTLVENSLRDIGLSQFRSEIKQLAKNEVQYVERLKYFHDNGISIRYEYYDKWGEFIDSVVISPS